MKNVEITLNGWELRVAALLGSSRRVDSVDQGRASRLTCRQTWDVDIDGAAAELAVGKYLGVYCVPGVNTFKAPDVGAYQVRSTPYANGCLIVRPGDNPSETYVLVVTDTPRFVLVGSYLGYSARQPEFLRPANSTGGPSWWVPQSRLDDLPTPVPDPVSFDVGTF